MPEWLQLTEGMDRETRRETVLHHTVKRILQDARELAVPELSVEVGVPTDDGRTLYGRWGEPAHVMELDLVAVEEPYDGIIPDVSCKAWPEPDGRVYWPMFIEVTVTNPIDDERLARIREKGCAALEIDLGLVGGRVTLDQLRRLVVGEVVAKRWLFHPELEEQRVALEGRLRQQALDESAAAQAQAREAAEQERMAEERRQRVLGMPVQDVAREYLDAVTHMLEARVETNPSGQQAQARSAVERAARELVADATDKMALHGFPEAADANLLDQTGILARLLSIQLGRPVGYRYENVMGVLNAIRQSQGIQRSTFTLYFIAVRVFAPPLSASQQDWFDAWANEVRESIRAGERTYLREPAYDRLLSLLFPEMAESLARPGGKLKASDSLTWDGEAKTFRRLEVPERRRAGFLQQQPATQLANSRLLDTRPGDRWLKGRDLEAWKKAHPEAARAWFGGPTNDDEAS